MSRTPAFRQVAALAAGLALVALTACGGGDGWKPPAKGQASVLFRDAGNGLDAKRIGGPLNAFSIAADGTLAVYDGAYVYTFSPDRKAATLWKIDLAKYGGGGLVALPDHTFAVGAWGCVYLRDAKGRMTLLAGVVKPGGTRHRPVPQTADAATYHFYGVATPFGRRPDGTLLVSDEEAVWALKDGTLTRLYLYPDNGGHEGDDGPTEYVITSNALDGAGNAYVGPNNNDGDGHGRDLDRIRIVRPDATSAPLALPAKIPGIPYANSDLTVVSMAGGDGESVYVNTTAERKDEYLLRISRGSVTVLAHHRVTDGKRFHTDCTAHQPMQAREIPCALPETIAYRNGKLVMGGYQHYFLELAV
ncbi:hypothetical protein [Streptomyces sp. NPDC021020]|uniref:hypothetical protein n=1 Tax=Streptomyces sp. NPDC021020 TaxID=3365109 RepID=UPI0037B85DA4